MDDVELTTDETWMVESLMRNLIFQPDAAGVIDLESRFYTMILHRYGEAYTKRLIRSVHENVGKLRRMVYGSM